MQNLPDLRSITYQQSADTEVRTLLLPAAVLLYIEEGSKYVSSTSKSVHCASSGEFVFLQPNSELTIRNSPGAAGNYLAQGLIFEGSGLSNHLPNQEALMLNLWYCSIRLSVSNLSYQNLWNDNHIVGLTGEGIRYSDVLGLPHKHKAIGCI